MAEDERHWKVIRTITYEVKIVNVEEREKSKKQAIQEAKLRTTAEADNETFEAELMIGPNQIP